MILFLCLFLEMLFLFQHLLFGKSVSSEDVNPDFVRQSNEFYEVIMYCVLIML